ncbi:hypothetical protein V6N13_041634 [Hibiscus sabdariffa]|uniref:Uncharacterized protein n=1 Tax=Hibiscus sabdariffa TaxID=183260 RepID=A0ABR2RCM0_9ROSI
MVVNKDIKNSWGFELLGVSEKEVLKGWLQPIPTLEGKTNLESEDSLSEDLSEVARRGVDDFERGERGGIRGVRVGTKVARSQGVREQS